MLRLILVVVFCFLSGAALAERRVALVIGESDYRLVRPLKNPDNDARAIEGALKALGFEVTVETDRDLRRMRRALDDFREDAAGADVALVFFSGHGVEISGDNRLLPIDADATSLDALERTSLPLEEVRDAVASVGRIGIVLLDACRNDPFGGGAPAGANGRGAVALKPEVAAAAHPGLGRVGQAENMLFAFAAAPGETASDGEGEDSPFTAALVKYLGTDGLEIRSALTLVQQEVYDLSRGKQLPYVENGLPQIFFAAAKGDLPERERLLLAMADITPDLRVEVEKIAARKNMPLAPLYGALISADLKGLTPAERAAKLNEAADAFAAVQDQLRTLAADDPQVAALRKQAEEQLALGAYETAHKLGEDAVALDQKSAETLQDRAKERFLSEAASHYLNGGIALTALNYPDAVADYTKASAIYARYTADMPAADRDRQLLTLDQLGQLFVTTGSLTGAKINFQTALQIIGGQSQREPKNVRWWSDYALVEAELAAILRDQGDLNGALTAYRDSIKLMSEVYKTDRSNGTARNDIADMLLQVGDILANQGNRAEALKTYRAVLATKQALAKVNSGNAQLQRDIALAGDKIGEILLAQGDPAGAVQFFRNDRDLLAGLAAANPADEQLQLDLSNSHLEIGDALKAQGDLAGALAAYQTGAEMRKKLAATDPGNVPRARDLSIAEARVADARLAQGDLAGAIAAYRSSREILAGLVRGDVSNTGWQRDLAYADSRIGDVLKAQGDDAGALAAYGSALDLLQRLAANDLSNAEYQRNLISAHVKIGQMNSDRRRHLEEALRIATDLQARHLLAASDAWVIESLQKALSGG